MKKYQIFVSSTFCDLKEEREAIFNALLKADYFPVAMENFGAPGMNQSEYIEKLLDATDYYVLILAGKYGSLNPEGVGYTEAEYEYAKSKGIPILPFVVKNMELLPRVKTEVDEEKIEKLNRFREKVMKDILCVEYDHDKIDSLCTKVLASLTKAVNETPRPGWVRENIESAESSTPDMVMDLDSNVDELVKKLSKLTEPNGVMTIVYRGMTEKETDYSNYWNEGKPMFDALIEDAENLFREISFRICSSQLNSEIDKLILKLKRASQLASDYKIQYTVYRNSNNANIIDENKYTEYESIMFSVNDDYKKISQHIRNILKKRSN